MLKRNSVSLLDWSCCMWHLLSSLLLHFPGSHSTLLQCGFSSLPNPFCHFSTLIKLQLSLIVLKFLFTFKVYRLFTWLPSPHEFHSFTKVESNLKEVRLMYAYVSHLFLITAVKEFHANKSPKIKINFTVGVSLSISITVLLYCLQSENHWTFAVTLSL